MEYSIVIPVFNSEASLKELHNRIAAVIEQISLLYEVIYVDDASLDHSWKVLNEIKIENPKTVKIIQLAKNFGQHNATICGFSKAQGDRIITLDDDLQHNPEDIKLLVEVMDSTETDVVYGVSSEKFKLKKIGHELYKSGSKIAENALGEGSSFRLLKNTLAQKIVQHNHPFPFIEEIIYWYTNKVNVIAVPFAPRKYGTSNYGSKGIFTIVKNNSLNYSNWPLKVMMVVGSLLSFVFFLVGIYYIIKKLILNISVPGFTALIVSICFTASLMLLCFGILGYYIKNILMRFNNRPVYYIHKEK